MSIDPLAEKYSYNSTYAFQENKMGMGRELEGLELVEFPIFLEETIIIEPVQPVIETAPLEMAPIELAPIEVTNVSEMGFLERLGNALGDAWDYVTGGSSKNEAQPESPMEQTIENNAPEAPVENVGTRTSQGRGSNNRTPDDTAVGDHTVRNDKGSTTYKVNENNPNKNSQGKGFETVKRVDYTGAAHKTKSGESIPTPHVQEGKTVRPAVPGVDMPK